MTIEKAQEHKLVSPRGRAQQPDGIEMAETVQQGFAPLGQQTVRFPIRQVRQQGYEPFGSSPKSLTR